MGSSFIKTEGAPSRLALIKEKSYTGSDIIYVDVEIQDENGNLCTQDARDVSYTVKGGKILGTISGNLTTDHLYPTSECETEKGRALVVVKKTQKSAILTAKPQNMAPVSIEI